MIHGKKGGFTIIEVVVVLAIAGLIFGIVFWALPNLRTTQRDLQRKSDLGNIMALLTTYKSQRGTLPITSDQVDDFQDNFVIPGNYVDPLTGMYSVVGISEDVPNGHSVYPEVGEIFFKARHFCNDNAGGPGTDQIQHGTASQQSIVVWTQLERGGILCFDNE